MRRAGLVGADSFAALLLRVYRVCISRILFWRSRGHKAKTPVVTYAPLDLDLLGTSSPEDHPTQMSLIYYWPVHIQNKMSLVGKSTSLPPLCPSRLLQQKVQIILQPSRGCAAPPRLVGAQSFAVLVLEFTGRPPIYSQQQRALLYVGNLRYTVLYRIFGNKYQKS